MPDKQSTNSKVTELVMHFSTILLLLVNKTLYLLAYRCNLYCFIYFVLSSQNHQRIDKHIRISVQVFSSVPLVVFLHTVSSCTSLFYEATHSDTQQYIKELHHTMFLSCILGFSTPKYDSDPFRTFAFAAGLTF